MKKVFFLFFIFISSLFLSCSLNYTDGENSEDKIPEFIFKNVKYIKYKSAKKNLVLNADLLEQYKIDGSVYAKNNSFKNFDSEGNIETSGTCYAISADIKKDIYTLYDNISITLNNQKMQIEADILSFNKKNEQITGSKKGQVSVKRENIFVSGTAFSASGVNRSFEFSDKVSGIITTDDSNEALDAE